MYVGDVAKELFRRLSWPLDVLLRFSVVGGISDGRCLTVRVQLIAQAHRPQLGLLLICPDQELSMTWPLARSEGFEPPALGIEIRCSIQLSYERAEASDIRVAGAVLRVGTSQCPEKGGKTTARAGFLA